MASTPALNRNEESAKLSAQFEGPIASRLRSRFRIGDVKTSQTECTNNQTDKPSQVSRHEKDKSNNSVTKKSEVHTASTSTSTIGQPSTDKSTNKINDSKPKSVATLHESSSCVTCQCAKNSTEDSSETKINQDVKNQHVKMKASQPPLKKTESSSNNKTNQSSKDQEEPTKIETQPPLKKTESSSNNKTNQSPKDQEEPTKIENSVTNMSNSCKPSYSDAWREKEKARPSQEEANRPLREYTIQYIRWKGSEKTSTCWSCALCEKNMANFPNGEELRHPSYEENELRLSFLRGEEEEFGSVLPEASVLPCNHVFHSICLSTAMQILELIDPPCPICLSMS
ncbi:Zinc finger, RING-type [Sesbania bispinosa]|nr:Zinc finger, RING-type [Sesbania bispinosa]